MKSYTPPIDLFYAQTSLLSPRKRNTDGATVRVTSSVNELLLQAGEVEDQTQVFYLGKKVPLWQALRSVCETCFSLWLQIDATSKDDFIDQASKIADRLAKEGTNLVYASLQNPMQARALARVVQLGHNFLRTIDKTFDALLRYPTQRSVTAKPQVVEVAVDWAVGGIAEWNTLWAYAFELDQADDEGAEAKKVMRRTTKTYPTDRSARAQISMRVVANMFFIHEDEISHIEARALSRLKKALGVQEIDVNGLFDV